MQGRMDKKESALSALFFISSIIYKRLLFISVLFISACYLYRLLFISGIICFAYYF